MIPTSLYLGYPSISSKQTDPRSKKRPKTLFFGLGFLVVGIPDSYTIPNIFGQYNLQTNHQSTRVLNKINHEITIQSAMESL